MTDLRQKHTLIVPTYNRHELLHQLLVHYAEKHADRLNILVLDSSNPDVLEQNTTGIAELNAAHGMQIRHLTFANDIPMAEKLARGLASVETPYASFCADDDIVFPAGIAAALHCLDADSSVAAAHGFYFSFMPTADHEIYLQNEYSGKSLDEPYAGARLFRLCQRYESLFYAVCRTADLKRVFDGVREMESLAFQEFFQSAALLMRGKAIRLPVVYAGRRSGDAAEPDRDKWQTYYWFADSPEDILQHYQDFRRRFLDFYEASAADEPKLERDDARSVLDLSMMGYFAGGYPPAYMHSRLEHLWPDSPFIGADDLDDLSSLNIYQREGEQLPWQVRAWRWATQRFAPEPRYHPHRADIPFDWMRDDDHPLNAKAATLGGHPWLARIPQSIEWVRDNPEFEKSYLELCSYLNAQG